MHAAISVDDQEKIDPTHLYFAPSGRFLSGVVKLLPPAAAVAEYSRRLEGSVRERSQKAV
jgi:hypothetical protein